MNNLNDNDMCLTSVLLLLKCTVIYSIHESRIYYYYYYYYHTRELALNFAIAQTIMHLTIKLVCVEIRLRQCKNYFEIHHPTK